MIASQELGYSVIERSPIGTGIDYWLGEESETLSLERMARLEISGIRRGSNADIRARVREKFERLSASGMELPVFVIVVEFSAPTAEVQKK